MTLRFHRELYDGKAVDAAVKQLADYATFELIEEPSYWVVTIEAEDADETRAVAGELGNFALGLTIQQRGGG